MEIIITILLTIIVLELYFVLDRLEYVKDLLQRIWQGLFNTPNNGLSMLNCLEKFEKITKLKEEKRP